MIRLHHVGRNVADLPRATTFYADALGFEPQGPATDDPRLAAMLGASRATTQYMQLGAQGIALTQIFPNGAPYPHHATSNDSYFQHIAIVTTDIFAAAARATKSGATPISIGGPQKLPLSSGGVTAWKFRDPEGHALEFLEFPPDSPWQGDALNLGFDHSAISIKYAGRSIAFYKDLGLSLQHRQTNRGVEQDRLDGLNEVTVDVIAMMPTTSPHVELLCYQTPSPPFPIALNPTDIAADRLAFAKNEIPQKLLRDPDGHFLLIPG